MMVCKSCKLSLSLDSYSKTNIGPYDTPTFLKDCKKCRRDKAREKLILDRERRNKVKAELLLETTRYL